MNFFQKHHRLLFYSSWLILALAQSASTELIADEAYYWVYSQFPAWGYFDHPPMIAVLIKTGDALFHNELGVRLICAFFSTFAIVITESLTERKNPFLFYTIVLSIAVLQVGGFLAVPDTPLLFFTALFFYAYCSFIKNTSWKTALFIGLSITFLFYTKYHGLLIVLFVFISNVKLLARWQTWLAASVVILLYSPHLYWQWQHDWLSFRYHLFESNVNAYKFSFTTDYLLGQIVLAGPIAGILLLPAAFIYRPKNRSGSYRVEKALKFTLVGIYAIFLLSAFRGKVEANWTMPALIPLIVLSHQYIIDKFSWIKPLRVIAFISLLLIIAGRLYLVVDMGPDNSFKGRFHNNDLWAKAIKQKTGDIPVVFYNSYQRASLYWFYSGVPSHSHNSYRDRRNNYNFWPTESNLLGKNVFIADVHDIATFPDTVHAKKGMTGLRFDTLYAALSQVKIISDKTVIVANEMSQGIISLFISAQFPEKYSAFIKSHPEIHTELVAGIFNGKELLTEFGLEITAQQIADWKVPHKIVLETNDLSLRNADALRFGIRVKNYLPTHNSATIELVDF